MLMIAVPLLVQKFVEAPGYMVKDMLNVTTRCVQDFYFNSVNSAMGYSATAGVFYLGLYYARTNAYNSIGFRAALVE